MVGNSRIINAYFDNRRTLFALIYGFLWVQRLSTLLQTTVVVFVALIVIFCITAHRQTKNNIEERQEYFLN